MSALRTSDEYEEGVEQFIDFARRHVPSATKTYLCPCVNCSNGKLLTVNDIRDHLICDGIDLRYTKWIWHGEKISTTMLEEEEDVNDQIDKMNDMIHDVGMEGFGQSRVTNTFKSHAETPLYHECSDYTLLTVVLHLFNLKAKHGWTDQGFNDLLQLLSELLPKDNVLP